MENTYFAKAELDYRREQIREQLHPAIRRRRARAEAVRRVLAHLR